MLKSFIKFKFIVIYYVLNKNNIGYLQKGENCMREHEINKAIKECIKNYFKEDKTVMIDESLMRIKGFIFYIYDLIFFGNKIIISEKTLEKIEKSKSRITYKVYSDNCSYLLKNMEKDEYNNYTIVDLDQYGKSTYEGIVNYLQKNPSVVYLLANRKLYNKLLNEGLKDRLKLLEVGMKITSLCKNKAIKFVTLGFIKHEDGKMFLQKRSNETLIKVYNSEGEEKEGEIIEVEINDIILTRSNKRTKYSFNLYKIVTRHTRNSAINIIWTDMLKGEKTNFYVKKLDYKYQKMIEDNS